MPPYRSAGMLSFPEFRGFTRSLIVWNLGIFFLFLLLHLAAPAIEARFLMLFALTPALVLHGFVWQLFSYSFLHAGILSTALELLSIWFLAAFLEVAHGSRWVAELYFLSAIGAGAIAVIAALVTASSGGMFTAGMIGASGGVFGLLIVFAVLYGDMQFTLFPLPIGIRAKYLVAIYMLIALAEAFGQNRMMAILELGGALFGFIYAKTAPRLGFTGSATRGWMNWRNDYYRWKRRNAAKKFEVYMRKQNRDVHFDKDGRYVDPDTGRPSTGPTDPNDRRWMN